MYAQPAQEPFEFEVSKPVPNFQAKLTGYVLLACIAAASGGFLFGTASYASLHCFGFVRKLSVVDFVRAHVARMQVTMGASQVVLQSWSLCPGVFPNTLSTPSSNFYCKYNDRLLQTFASMMHFVGAFAAFPAGHCTAKFGRTRRVSLAHELLKTHSSE